MRADPHLVEDIRAASRRIVRALGFMRPTLAGTAYSPSAVHALIEISARESMTAGELARVLGLEKSSVSRLVGRLAQAGELKVADPGEDGRVKPLVLTARGRRTVRDIHAHGRTQVRTAMAQLNPPQARMVAQGLAAYAHALEASRPRTGETASDGIAINSGYRPGVVGRVVQMHAEFYARDAGFGQDFESQVAAGMAEFVGRLTSPRNGLWLALRDERVVGSIAIDGEDLGDNLAHLRWFILDGDCRGRGVGRRLLAEAMAFCDRSGFAATRLWTFKGLDAARRLYESVGFALAHEVPGNKWGRIVTEQQFIRSGPPRP